MHKQNFSTKAMVEAGLISTIIAAIFLMSVTIPMFSRLSLFILPIPVAVLCIRHNYSVAAGAVFVSAAMMGMVYSPVTALEYAVMFGVTGLTLGYCIKTGKEGWAMLAIVAASATFAAIIDLSIVVVLFYNGGFFDFLNQIIKGINDYMNLVYESYRSSGMTETQIQQIQQVMGIFTTNLVLELIPSAIAFSAFSFAAISYSLTAAVLKRLRYEVKAMPPFSELYINNRIGTGILLFTVIGALMSKNGIAGGQIIAGASMMLVQMIFAVDGVALATYYFRRRFNMSKLLTALIIFLTISSPTVSVAYSFAGILDMIFDFRKLDPFRRKIAR